MSPRANWKGYLKLSLVTCPVSLYTASSPSRISFNTVNRRTGNRVKRVYVDAETNVVVAPADQGRAFPAAKAASLPEPTEPSGRRPASTAARAEPAVPRGGLSRPMTPEEPRGAANAAARGMILVGDQELDALRPENDHTLEIDEFVPRSEIDLRYLDAPYYVAPGDEAAAEPFAVIREAMRDEDVAGLGRLVFSGRERRILLQPCGRGLLGIMLRTADEVRDPERYFAAIADRAPPEEMTDLARIIVARKRGHFDPERLRNPHRDAVAALIRARQAGQAPAIPAPAGSNVIDIMDALRRSIAAAGKPGAPGESGAGIRPSAKPPRKSAGQRKAAVRQKPGRAR
jgi:DNA end-binding protein Ku